MLGLFDVAEGAGDSLREATQGGRGAAKGLLGQVRMTEEKPRTVSGSKPPSRSRGVSTSTGHTPFGVA